MKLLTLLILICSMLLSACADSKAASKAEKEHVSLLALKIEIAYTNSYLDSLLTQPGQGAERAIAAKEIDERISKMNSNGWSLCSEEIYAIRAMLRSAGRASKADRDRIERLRSIVDSKCS